MTDRWQVEFVERSVRVSAAGPMPNVDLSTRKYQGLRIKFKPHMEKNKTRDVKGGKRRKNRS